MRDEMFKRLDELFAWAFGVAPHGEVVAAHIAEWQALRAELEAERCEHCAHAVIENGPETVFCRSLWRNCERGFCCSHFTKKELSK